MLKSGRPLALTMTINSATNEYRLTVQPGLKANLQQISLWLSLLLTLVLWVNAFASQQQDDPAYVQALKLYESGDARGAVASLQPYLKQYKEHADAWHILGVAQYNLGKLKDARKAFEQAVLLRPTYEPSRINLAFIALFANDLKKAEQEAAALLSINRQSAEAYYIFGKIKLWRDDIVGALLDADASLKANPDYANSYWLKTQALINSYIERDKKGLQKYETAPNQTETVQVRVFKAALESLERYLALRPKLKENVFWQQQLEALRTYAGSAEPIDLAESLTGSLRPKILSREKASYTEEARRNGVQGVVKLKVVFSSDGTIKHPLILRSLGHGLDEQCLLAASKIRFTPATRDGKPVSVIANLEYTFNLY